MEGRSWGTHIYRKAERRVRKNQKGHVQTQAASRHVLNRRDQEGSREEESDKSYLD